MKPPIEYRAGRKLPTGAKPVGRSPRPEYAATKPLRVTAPTTVETNLGATPPSDRKEYLKLKARARRARETAAAKEMGITVAEYRVRKSKGEFG